MVFSFLLFSNSGMSLDEIPNDFIGNFYDKSGKEYWAYGVRSNFFIGDSQCWDYEKILSDKNSISLWLKSKGLTKRVDIVKLDSLNFDFFENEKIFHCSKKVDLIKTIFR